MNLFDPPLHFSSVLSTAMVLKCLFFCSVGAILWLISKQLIMMINVKKKYIIKPSQNTARHTGWGLFNWFKDRRGDMVSKLLHQSHITDINLEPKATNQTVVHQITERVVNLKAFTQSQHFNLLNSSWHFYTDQLYSHCSLWNTYYKKKILSLTYLTHLHLTSHANLKPMTTYTDQKTQDNRQNLNLISQRLDECLGHIDVNEDENVDLTTTKHGVHCELHRHTRTHTHTSGTENDDNKWW